MFDINVVAENIREYRNKKGFSQYEFAEKLEISPQAVSKWECGQSCPTIENFYAMSELLDVSVDELIGNNKNYERMMIGVDGGGTKTEFVLFTESGKIKNRVVLSGCNPNTVGLQNAIEILKVGIDTLLKISGRVCGIFIGAAGLDSGNNTEQIKKRLHEIYPNIKIQCENDIFNVIACGKNLEKCVAAICGTGMIIYANQNGQLKHFGGCGYLLDKGGSGYHIGRDAICATQDARDGISEHSILADFVEEKLGGTVWDNIQDIYRKGQAYIASFAPCVFRAYEHGDAVAEQILENNVRNLAELINFAINHCNVGKYVVASGSILREKKSFQEMLKGMLEKDAELDIPNYPPVYGACIMCCKLCGIDAKKIENTFMDSYQEYC